jgi:hypothetical protein
MKGPLAAVVVSLACTQIAAQWVMVVNNTFLAAPNGSSIALLNRSDGSLVNRDWIVPAAGAGNWNGNCSAQDVVQVGSQVWIGSSNSNCAMPAAIYVYDVSFAGPLPVATYSQTRFLTAADVGIASTQPRGLHWNAALGIVYMSDGNGIHALSAGCNYLGTSLPGNCWGMTLLPTGDLVYSVIAYGGIQRATPDLTASLGTFAGPAPAGFWPYELDVNNAGNLVASGFAANTGYNVREWSPSGTLLGDPWPGVDNMRGMAPLGNGTYLVSRNSYPYDLVVWTGSTSFHVIPDTGPNQPAQNTFGGYMMGRLDAPQAALTVAMSQPAGPGTFRLDDGGLLPGTHVFNLVSLEPAPGGPGTGPYLGLFTANVNGLLAQVLAPAGTLPFHLVAVHPTFQLEIPSGVPAGLTVEVVAFEFANGVLGRVSSVASHVTF